MVLKGHQQIIFVENFDPIRAEKLVWHKDPALQRLGRNLHPVAAEPSVTPPVSLAADTRARLHPA